MELEPLIANGDRQVTQWPSVSVADMSAWDDDIDAASGQWQRLLRAAEDNSEESSVVEFLGQIVPFEVAAGRWDDAVAHALEGREIATAAGSWARLAVITAGLALVEVCLGDELACRLHADEAMRLAESSGASQAQRLVAAALGLLELSLEAFPQAHHHLEPLVAGRRAAGVREPGELRFVPDEIEALTRMGRQGEARELLAWYQEIADETGRVTARAASLRCLGVLQAAEGDIAGALPTLDASIALYATTADPLGPGRALLASGSMLRRAGRRRAARARLEAALEQFGSRGARIWANACRSELARISEVPR